MDKALASLGDPPKPRQRGIAPNRSEPAKENEDDTQHDVEPAKEDSDNANAESTDANADTQDAKSGTTDARSDDAQAKAPEGKKKPWDLVNQYKGDNSKLKTRVAELEKQVNDHKSKQPEDLTPKLEAANKRLQELEQEIQFVEYSKSSDFNSRFQKPFEDAFSKASSDLRGVQVQYEEGGDMKTRPIDVDDIAFLANLPPEKARIQIKAWFPEDFAEVRNHVTEVRRLGESRAEALKSARENGTQRTNQFQQQMKGIQDHAVKTWEKVTAENATKFDFLKTVDGDDEHNTALTKAQEMVTQGLSKNAYDPRLSPEDRENVIRQQASIRDRAIAYSPLKLANKRLKAKVAELEKALGDYKKTEPGAGDRRSKDNGTSNGSNGMVGAMDRLSKYV